MSEQTKDTQPVSPEHEWVKNDPRWPSIRDIEFCAICTVGRRADGKNKPCRGWTPAITLRVEQPVSARADVAVLARYTIGLTRGGDVDARLDPEGGWVPFDDIREALARVPAPAVSVPDHWPWCVACGEYHAACRYGSWAPIETAPRDREIVVYAPSLEGLGPLVSFCLWHPDAGFCVDELREPTLWQESPAALQRAREGA